jgi:alkanesulfonate monooxygenase SsuD/methylene tetrahydromethanopterin reductase-like flavin-dependent oxidoreductase (luciferase family)
LLSRAGERTRWGIDGLALGISLGGISAPGDWRRQLEWVERAEELGLHSVWLPEMHFAPGACARPLLALAGFAARTRRLRLATTSLLLPIHHPLQIAEDVATLDAISGQRVVLGLGRGFRAPLFAGFGIDAATKRDLFDSSLEQIIEAWDGSSPPMAVAAFGRKGLAQAARHGLPYLASPIESLDLLDENLRFHREQLHEDVDPGALVVPIMRTVHVAQDDAEARRVIASLEEEGKRMMQGKVPKALGRAAAAGVEERAIIGTASRVVDQIAHYRERVGLDLLISRVEVGGARPEERHASLTRLVEEVLPAL